MDLNNKICIITGATTGIGKAAAEKFANVQGELLLIVRNRHRGERVVKEIVRKSANSNIKIFTADLSSKREVQELSDKIHSNYDKIDVLINNAGAFFSKFHLSIDGIEATFAVNYLSRFLLTNMLLDLIIKSPTGRIINITGEHYRKGKPDFTMIAPGNYSPFRANSQAKLADMLFVMELSRRLKNTSVTVNAMHPGAVATGIINNDPDASGLSKLMYSMIKPFFKSPHKAAEDIYYLAFAENLKLLTGKYFCGKKLKDPSKLVNDRDLAKRLWEISESLTGYKNNFFNKSILEK